MARRPSVATRCKEAILPHTVRKGHFESVLEASEYVENQADVALAPFWFSQWKLSLNFASGKVLLRLQCLGPLMFCSFHACMSRECVLLEQTQISSMQVKTNFGIYLIPSERLSLTYLIIVDRRWWEIFKARSKKCLQTNWLQILYLIVGRSFSLKSEYFVISPTSHWRWACCRLDFGLSAFAVQNSERVEEISDCFTFEAQTLPHRQGVLITPWIAAEQRIAKLDYSLIFA